MPWCPACERFLSPPTVTPEGRCPSCRGPVEAERVRTREAPTQTTEDLGPVPWHIKVFAVAAVVYLGWRLVQGIDWLIRQLF